MIASAFTLETAMHPALALAASWPLAVVALALPLNSVISNCSETARSLSLAEAVTGIALTSHWPSQAPLTNPDRRELEQFLAHPERRLPWLIVDDDWPGHVAPDPIRLRPDMDLGRPTVMFATTLGQMLERDGLIVDGELRHLRRALIEYAPAAVDTVLGSATLLECDRLLLEKLRMTVIRHGAELPTASHLLPDNT